MKIQVMTPLVNGKASDNATAKKAAVLGEPGFTQQEG